MSSADDVRFPECGGREVVAALPWDSPGADAAGGRRIRSAGDGWGFLVCRVDGDRPTGVESPRLHGVVGLQRDGRVEEAGRAIPLDGEVGERAALRRFALACGLSIVDLAAPELGDAAVVAGLNPLAASVRLAAKLHGMSTACLADGARGVDSEALDADAIIDATDFTEVDPALDRFADAAHGRVLYFDASGQEALVNAMALRVGSFGDLVLCRADVTASVRVDLRSAFHLTSAKVHYWSWPATLQELLAFTGVRERADRLIALDRVPSLGGSDELRPA